MSIASTIPRGVCGDWRVDIEPYRQLVYMGSNGPVLYMADVQKEQETQGIAIEEAKRRGGHWLTAGLGLAVFADEILPYVKSLLIVEKNWEVVALVWSTLKDKWGERVSLLLADARNPPAWLVQCRFDGVWLDIWPLPNAEENRTDRAAMEGRYLADWTGFWECR